MPGDEVDLIGLGNTFDYPEDLQEAIVVAGGVGVAPFHLLLQDPLWPPGDQDRLRRRVAGPGPAAQEMTAGARVEIASEDGSCYCKGFVTRLLEEHLATGEGKGRRLYVCGPTPMMKAVQELAARYGVA